MKKRLVIFILSLIIFTGCAHQKGFNYAAHRRMNNRIEMMHHARHGGKDMLASHCKHAKTGNTFYRFGNLLKRKKQGPVKPPPCFVK